MCNCSENNCSKRETDEAKLTLLKCSTSYHDKVDGTIKLLEEIVDRVLDLEEEKED